MAKRSRDVEQPIVLGCFTLTAAGLEVTGRPSFEEWEHVGTFIKRTHRAAGFWLADWLRYGEGRADWADRLSQAVDVTGLSESTLKNVRAVGRIPSARRRAETVEFSQHLEIAQIEDAAEQEELLEACEVNGWSVRELRLNIRSRRRTKIIAGQASLVGMYRVVYADPPWSYNDSGVINSTDGYGHAARHYTSQSIEELCKLPVAAHVLKDAVLFLWVTAPMLLEKPGPREVIDAWGFTPKTGMVWDKVLGNFGHYVHVQHEHVIICTRGSCTPDAPTPQPGSVYHERRSSVHSQKPAGIRRIIEQLYTTGPYLELFGRERVEGWDVFGDDARLWAGDVTRSAVG